MTCKKYSYWDFTTPGQFALGLFLLLFGIVVFVLIFTIIPYNGFIERGEVVPFPLSLLTPLNPVNPCWMLLGFLGLPALFAVILGIFLIWDF